MRYTQVFALAAVSSAFVLPSEEILAELAPQRNDRHQVTWHETVIDIKDSVLGRTKSLYNEVSDASKHAWDEIYEHTTDAFEDAVDSVSGASKHAYDDIYEQTTTNIDHAFESWDEASSSFTDNARDTAADIESWLSSETAAIAEEVEDRADTFTEMVDSWRPDDREDGPPPPPPGKHHRGPPKDGRKDGPPPPGHDDLEDGPPPPPGKHHRGHAKDGRKDGPPPPGHDDREDGPPPPPPGKHHRGPPKDGRKDGPPPPGHDDREDGPPPPPPSSGKDHRGPPKDGREDGPPPPGHDEDGPRGKPPHHKPPHHGPPHHGPPHHHKPNLTVYELIAKSKYTTKLAFFINQYPDLIEALNSTEANYTIFAPTDRAFEKIPEHAPKPSKEQLKALLTYHVVPDVYSAGRVLATHTVPTLLKSKDLGKEPLPQRLRLHLGFRGLTVNFYSRIVAVNIFGTNGVIHGVDSLLVPPPKVLKIIDLFPSGFSTLELGLTKTGLLDKLNSTKSNGGTFFTPSNRAFAKLGPRISAFLFSEHGLKYLKALLEYHVVPKNTLYSDAFYSAEQADAVAFPRGRFHVELPTLLKDRSLSVDIARFGGFITIKINAFVTVAVQDGIADDGVIHVPGNVLIPPRKVDGEEELSFWDGEEMEVEDFKARFESLIDEKADL